jgi:hypothetical protein
LGTNARLSDTELLRIFAELVAICDLVVTEPGEEVLDALAWRSGRYSPPQIVNQFHIFAAKENAPRPPNPDARLQEILHWDQMGTIKRRWAEILAK